MQKQAAVIEVHRPDGRGAVVADETLRVDKAGGVLIDFHPARQQHLIEAARHAEDELLVRDARHDDAHVHAALRRREHRVQQIVAEHEIGREEPRVVRRLRQKVDIEPVARRLGVERGVVIAQHPAVLRGGLGGGRRGRHGHRLLLLQRKRVPEREEHVREAAHRRARQAEARVLPVAVGVLAVDVPVGEIHAAAVGDRVVHDEHFPVVAVVGRPLQREQGVERHAADAQLFKREGVAEVERRDAPEVVVHHAHVQPLAHLLREDVDDALPHLARLDDEILEIDRLFCRSEVGEHVGVHRIAQRVIADVLGAHEGIAGLMLQPADGLFHALFPLEGRPAAGERSRLPGLLHAPQALSQRACRAPVAEEKVQQRTRDRYCEDHKQPQDFIRRLVTLDDDKQHQQHRRDGQRQRDVRRIR